MDQKEILNLSLREPASSESKPELFFNYDHSTFTYQSASYELLSVSIENLVASIREQGRNPTVNEVISIVMQVINEQR